MLREDRLTFNQYDYNPTKHEQTQHREHVFVYDIETYPYEENGDCVAHSIGFFPLSKISNSLVYRDLTESEI